MPANDSSYPDGEFELEAYWDDVDPRQRDRNEGTIQPSEHAPPPFRDGSLEIGRTDEHNWEDDGGACLVAEDEHTRRSAWEHLDDDAFNE